MGAHFYLEIFTVTKLSAFIQILIKEKYNLIGGFLEGENYKNLSCLKNEKWALFLGNEAHGIKKEIRNLLTYCVVIPKSGRLESLNIAIAGGILLAKLKEN